MLPSAVVTRVDKPLTADAFAATPVVLSLTVFSSAVISVLLVDMLPSAVVTRVSKLLTADAFAATPVVPLLTVVWSAVFRYWCRPKCNDCSQARYRTGMRQRKKRCRYG